MRLLSRGLKPEEPEVASHDQCFYPKSGFRLVIADILGLTAYFKEIGRIHYV